MEELINQVAQRANISPDQARTAVQTVLEFAKQRLPPQIAGQLDAALSGSAPDLGDAAKGLGGLFGR